MSAAAPPGTGRGLARWFAAALVAPAGCLPLTLGREPAVDFERHAIVFLAPFDGPAGYLDVTDGSSARDYLAAGLDTDSGFRRVVYDPAGATVALRVSLDVTRDADAWDTLDDEEGEPEESYDATATFELIQLMDQSIIDQGSVDDSASTEAEAIEDALDELVNHYLHPYRL